MSFYLCETPRSDSTAYTLVYFVESMSNVLFLCEYVSSPSTLLILMMSLPTPGEKANVSRKWGVRLTRICHEGCASGCAVLLHERVACRLYHSNMTSLKMTSKVRTVSFSDSVNSRCLQVGWGCHGNMCCFPSWKDDFISTFRVDAEINT